MKSENYITIQGWMIKELGLSGNDLICYALIYGFSQDEESEFRGSLSYIAEWLGVTKQNARLIIKRLVKNGYIIKHDEVINKVKFCRYAVGLKQLRGGAETATGGMAETATDNNNIYNNKDKKEDAIASKKGVGVDFKEIADYWNTHCQSYASVNILTEKRKTCLRKLMQNNHACIDDVKKAMDILESADPFWKGDNDKSWKASFDWFVKDTNGCFARILEGEMTKNANSSPKIENNNPQTSKYR